MLTSKLLDILGFLKKNLNLWQNSTQRDKKKEQRT